MTGAIASGAVEAARASGLIRAGAPLLVMLSGGADSVCLLDVALRLEADVSALHVNYGLRAEAGDDEEHCRSLCERLGVPLAVERVALERGGNLQARARDARYAFAERIARGDYATAHTLDDQAETVLYRLASSPGPRSLAAIRPRRGRLVRPLLAARREQTRAHCRAAGLAWREDRSNADPRFARSVVRHEALPALERIAPGAAATIAATSAQVAEQLDLLERIAGATVASLGERPDVAALRELDAALALLVLRQLARAASPGAAIGPDAGRRILALGADGGSAALDLGGGLRAIVEYGRLRFTCAREDEQPQPVVLDVPGAVRFGDWELEAGASGDVALRAGAVGVRLTVRGWRDGDRMRPQGVGGTRKLQDLFTDRKLPRAERRTIPVVEGAAGIVWIPGIAVAEGSAARPGDPQVRLSARRAPVGG